MALGLVSPLLNRGVRSRWLASLPVAGSKMLTIDSNGDTSFQDVPVAAWGSITGTLSAQTDLQNALNAKLSLTGGTLTGGLYFSGAAGARLEMSSQQYTPGNVAINMPWGSGTLQGIYGSNGLVGFASAGFSYFEVNTSGLRLASTRSIAMGGTIASPEVFAFSGGSNTWEQRNSTNAQRFNLYGTYTDASNYRRLYVSSTTAGAFTIGVEGAGTGASGNTLTVPNAMSITNTLTMSGSGTQITGGQWWLYANGTAQFRVFNVNGYYGMSDLNTGGLSFGSGHGISWGSGSLNVPASGSITGDLFLYRNAAGQLDIRGDSGLRIRNVANTADASITAAAGTFSGRITTPSILLSGNFSSAAWTTSGVGLSHTARTLTDTSSTGTVAAAYTNVLGGNTIAASNATTYTDYASLFLGSPTTGTNVTITNPFSLITAGAARFGGRVVTPTGGDNYTPEAITFGSGRGFTAADSSTGAFYAINSNGQTASFSNTEFKLASNRQLAWSANGDNAGTATQLALVYEGAYVLGQRVGTNAQRFNLYGTYTDASNYRRLYLSSTTAGAFTLGVEGAGTGYGISNTLSIVNASTIRAFDGAQSFESGGTLTIRGGVGHDPFYGASAGTIVFSSFNNVGGGGAGAITITSGTTSRPSVMLNNNGITLKVGNATVNESYPAALELQGSEVTHNLNPAVGGAINFRTYGGTVGKGSNAGSISFILGTGATNVLASGTGGSGGAFTISGGAGGAASGTDGIGGTGSALTFTSGAGGASNGASGNRVGGNSGNIIFNIGAVGVGTTSNGSFGSVIWQQNSTEVMRLSSTGAFTITQPVSTSGSPTAFTLTGGAHTTLTASTEATDVNFNLARTVQFAAGALTTQRAFRIQAPTYSFASASTITTASTLSISGAPVAGTNATITNRWALNVESGDSNFGGAVRTSDLGITSGNRISIANQLWQFSMNGQDDISFTQQSGTDSWGVCVRLGGYSAGALPFGDVKWVRDAANIWGQRVGTNSQTLRIYNTFTDASNYIRQSLSFTTYSTTVHAQLAAEGAGTGAVNVPFVITPRGTGAFILGPMPDGTATGGNARGQNAVDLQAVKTAASQVASGRYSFTVGYANTASGEGSGAGGYNTSATGFGAFSWGNGCTTSGQYGITLGQNLTASGYCSTAFGRANSATAQHTLALGYYTSAWVQGMIAFGSGTRYTNPTVGDQQGAILPMLGWSAGPAAIELLANAADRLTVPTRCAFGFTVEIFGVKNKAGQAAFFHRQGIIKNIAGTTSLTGTIQTVGTDINPASASVSITADNTNDSLKIECTQPTGEFTGATGDSATDIITLVGHPFINGDEVCFSSLTGGSGLAIDTRYFVRDVSGNTFKLTTSFVGNTAINFTTDITAGTMDYIWYWHCIVKLSRINFGLY